MNEYARMHPFSPLRTMLLAVITGALPATVAGCVLDDTAPDAWDPAFEDGVFLPAGDQWNDCSTWDCNKNNPVLNTFPVDELNEDEVTQNEEGLAIEDLIRGGVSRNIDVRDGEILVRNNAHEVIASGHQVEGSRIMVSGTAGRLWEIRIQDSTRTLKYWDGTGYLWAYHLVYRPITIPATYDYVNLCNDPPLAGDEPGVPEGYEAYAIMIDGERYDRDQIEVDASSSATGWFNIACAGSALSKMVLMHYDPRIPAGQYHTSPAQRTATLKMITADYTGTGRAFTEPETDLAWGDVNGWNPLNPLPPFSAFEAIWTETGARCLNTPRVAPIGDVNDHLATLGEAPLPSCTAADLTAGWPAGDIWRTYDAP